MRPIRSILFLALLVTSAAAQDEFPVLRASHPRAGASSSVFGTANANCPQATCDTVWVGHSSSGPGGAFLGVGVGGMWDFDTDIAGTDSTQGWRAHTLAFTSGPNRPALQRPEFGYDYGNEICEGNTNLWKARELAGRKFVKRGV